MEMEENYIQQKLKTRLKGYHKHFRGRFTLLQDNLLTTPEYVLWDYCFSVFADWTPNRITYGAFDLKLKDIALFIQKDETTVSKLMSSLVEKGFIKEKGGLRYVSDFGFIHYMMGKKGKGEKIGIIKVKVNADCREEISHNTAETIDLDEIYQDMERIEYDNRAVNTQETPDSNPS